MSEWMRGGVVRETDMGTLGRRNSRCKEMRWERPWHVKLKMLCVEFEREMVKEENEEAAGDRSRRDWQTTLRDLGFILRVSRVVMIWWNLQFRKFICMVWWGRGRQARASKEVLEKYRWLKRQDSVTYLMCAWRRINPRFIHPCV